MTFGQLERSDLVLDSNVVFDWLLFADPSTARLAEAISTGRARWLATAAMRDEVERVLARGEIGRRSVDAPALLAAWERWVTPVPAPAQPCELRCTDPDDQKFIDLAVHSGAQALVSRDRALLTLAQRARRYGLAILPPAAWPAAAPGASGVIAPGR